LFKKSAEFLRVLLLHGEDPLEHPACRWVIITEVGDHLTIPVDGDPFGDEVFLDHVAEGISFDILSVAPGQEALRREVRCTAQLHDALCNLIRVNLFFLCVLEKLLGDALGMDPGRHEVMALVPEDAHDLRGKSFVQDADYGAWYPCVTAPFSMCWRARCLKVLMSVKNGLSGICASFPWRDGHADFDPGAMSRAGPQLERAIDQPHPLAHAEEP